MSATGRSEAAGTGVVRHPDDFYRTPAWCVRAILPHLVGAGNTLEPSCGDGAILDALRASGRFGLLTGVEMDAGRADTARAKGHAIHQRDFFTYDDRTHDLILGNPPFVDALAFVQHALSIVAPGGTVCMLLRLPWLASQKRAPWLRANTPSVYVLPKRPSFTGKGTDATDYAWLVWSDAAPTVRILDVEP